MRSSTLLTVLVISCSHEGFTEDPEKQEPTSSTWSQPSSYPEDHSYNETGSAGNSYTSTSDTGRLPTDLSSDTEDTSENTQSHDTGTTVEDTTDTGTAPNTVCTPNRFVPAHIATIPPGPNEQVLKYSSMSSCAEPGYRWHGFKQEWYARQSDGAVYCLYTYEIDTQRTRSDCPSCDWAFELQWGVPYEDSTQFCSSWYDPIDLASSTWYAIGFQASTSQGRPDLWWWNELVSSWTSDTQLWGHVTPLQASFDGQEWAIDYPTGPDLASVP